MFTIGQTLWLRFTESYYQKDLRPYIVTKIGRKWLTVAREGHPSITERVAISDLRLDGEQYSSPGRAYLSKEDFEEETALNAAWNKLQTYIRDSYRRPTNLTLADITTAIEALKIP